MAKKLLQDSITKGDLDMTKNNNRNPEVNTAKAALQKMKIEIAAELGIPNYDQLDKGNLPARIHGKIGGNMVRRMIANYERMLSDPNLSQQLISQQDSVAQAQLQQDAQEVKQYTQSIQ